MDRSACTGAFEITTMVAWTLLIHTAMLSYTVSVDAAMVVGMILTNTAVGA
jgi:hypothetical protein